MRQGRAETPELWSADEGSPTVAPADCLKGVSGSQRQEGDPRGSLQTPRVWRQTCAHMQLTGDHGTFLKDAVG